MSTICSHQNLILRNPRLFVPPFEARASSKSSTINLIPQAVAPVSLRSRLPGSPHSETCPTDAQEQERILLTPGNGAGGSSSLEKNYSWLMEIKSRISRAGISTRICG